MSLPQTPVEKIIKFDEWTSLLVQGALFRAVSGTDTPIAGSLADLPTLSRERTAPPSYQTRTALTTLSVAKKPLTMRASGHYGRREQTRTRSTVGVPRSRYVVPLHV